LARVFRLQHFAWGVALLASASVWAWPGAAGALDKQGSAHGGQAAGPDRGVEIAGSVLLGAALYNPSYAARPDNTGLALLRLASHWDLDLIGHRLSIPVDFNLFSDRRRAGGRKLLPTELDFISGLTSTWGLWTGTALEFGARYERDMPIDRGGLVQQYADARAKLLLDLPHMHERLARGLAGVALFGAATLGAFAYNPSYAARPDNSGIALLRYALNAKAVFWDHLGVAADTTFFTDRHAHNPVRPSELDLTVTVSGQLDAFELSVAFERDMPLDHGHYTQQMLFFYASWSFTAFSNQPKAAPEVSAATSQSAPAR
jgi:hypothetical protein